MRDTLLSAVTKDRTPPPLKTWFMNAFRCPLLPWLPARPLAPFVCRVFFAAAIVAMWYARSKKYGEKNVMYDSYGWYNHMLSDASQMMNMPEVTTSIVDTHLIRPKFSSSFIVELRAC